MLNGWFSVDDLFPRRTTGLVSSCGSFCANSVPPQIGGQSRSPGHISEAGPSAVILLGRSAISWLHLKTYRRTAEQSLQRMQRSSSVHGRRLGPANDVERDRLMRVAPEAFNFEASISGIQRVADDRRRRPRGSRAYAVPALARQAIGILPRRGCLFGLMPD
jgi:hypothetical protein